MKGLCQSQLDKLPHLRRRLSKVQMEEHANLASLVCWLSDACLSAMPAMTKAVVEMQQSFLQGHHTLLLDLQGLLHERCSKVTWEDCILLHDASKSHTQASLVEVMGRAASSIDATQLEKAEFELFQTEVRIRPRGHGSLLGEDDLPTDIDVPPQAGAY